jgi:hypothetical protein
MLECYKRSEINPIDQFQVLDYNFDEAVVYNAEQTSGYLNLNIFPKNNVTLSLQYPKLSTNLNSFDILFSKEEQKYRFNQFWDITKDRGEYSGLQIPLILTESNGYKFDLNPAGVDYAKPQTQRKKFRHKTSKIYLEREVSGNNKITLHFSDTKQTQSPR